MKPVAVVSVSTQDACAPRGIFTRIFPYLLIPAAAIVVYSNTVTHEFVFDDIAGILNNPLITRFDHFSSITRFIREPWRAVTQSSFALTIYLFGPDPRAFHITNILIHAINSVLVFGIARLVAGQWLSKGKPAIFALAAGLIHAVHPLYSEAVAYVWGQSSSLCALFYFGSLLLAMIGYREPGRRKYLWYGCALLAGILAWKTKEEAITLPFVIAGFFALSGSWRAAAGMILVPFGVASLRWSDIVGLYLRVKENQALVAAGADRALGHFTFTLTYVKASVFYYLRLFVFPLNQNADPHIEPVTRIADPLFLVSVLILVSLAALGLMAARRNRVVSFALLALLVSPLAAYVAIPLADVVAEHRAYISGLGFDLLVAWIISRAPRYSLAILATVALALGFMTFQRNRVWANSLTLWKDTEQKSLGLARPHLNLGLAYQSAGRLEEALTEYQHALSIKPKLVPAYVNIGGIYYSRNDLNNAELWLKRAVELSPSLSEPYINLALIAMRRDQNAKALELIEKAASLNDSYLVRLNKGDILARLGRYEEAMREYRRALELSPDLALKRQIEARMERLRTTHR